MLTTVTLRTKKFTKFVTVTITLVVNLILKTTFLLPKSALPDLPESVRRRLGFYLQ